MIAKGSLGTEMAAWEKVLEDEHIANVTEYVFRAFIRPGAPAAAAQPAAMPMEAAPAHDHHDHSHDHAH